MIVSDEVVESIAHAAHEVCRSTNLMCGNEDGLSPWDETTDDYKTRVKNFVSVLLNDYVQEMKKTTEVPRDRDYVDVFVVTIQTLVHAVCKKPQ